MKHRRGRRSGELGFGMVLPTGSMVWFEHPTQGYVPARVTQPGTKQITVAVDGSAEKHTMKISGGAAAIGRVFAESLEPRRDMLVFKAPVGAAVLHNLRLAHRDSLPFSSVGTVLVTCWPGGPSPDCGPRALWQHSACRLSEHSAPQAPHIYELAARAHRSMMRDGADQAIVLSGDSGSGKSQLAQLAMQLLLEIRTLGNPAPSVPTPAALRHLYAARLLDAFGMAETVRNRTASRFGKRTTLHFDLGSGQCVGGEIRTFQLELSRIAGPCAGGVEGRFREERNYHIFYQLCAGAQPDLRDRHDLLESSDYMLTARSPYAVTEQQTENRIDAREWAETEAAFVELGITEEDTESLLGALSAILRLGNVGFAPTEGAAGPDSMQLVDGQYGQNLEAGGPDTAAVAARLLGLSRAELEKALCYASVEAGRERAELPLSESECDDRRTMLAAQLYDRVFGWLEVQLNEAVASTGDVRAVSIFDLPGLTLYEANNLETLCSNYTCEKLAAHYYRQLFKVEHALYVAEQFHVPDLDKRLDNQSAIDLLEGNQHTMKTAGLLEIVREATSAQGHNDDVKLLQELNDAFGAKKQSHPNYAQPKSKASSFVVKHFNGDVSYNIVGFCASSRKLPAHIQTTMQHSSNRFLSKLFFANEGKVGDDTQAGVVLATQKQQFTDLGRTACHFVRCIRPAADSGAFDGAFVQAQTQVAQLTDLVIERQSGFPVRYQPPAFVQRYQMMSSRGSTSAEQVLKDCTRDEIVDGDAWQIGMSYIFLKDSCFAALESARSAMVSASVRIIEGWLKQLHSEKVWRNKMRPLVHMQAIVKGVLARGEFKKFRVDRQHIRRLEEGLAAAASRQSGGVCDPDDLDKLQSGLILALEDDYPSTELIYLIKDAERAVPELRAYRRTESLLAAAVSPPSKISLLEALWEAKSIGLTSGALLERAQASYDQSYAPKAGRGTEADAKEAKASLKQALEYCSKYPGERYDDRRRRLSVAVQMAKSLNLGGVDALFRDAQAAIDQLRGEMEWIADIKAAMDARKLHYLSGVIDRGKQHKATLTAKLKEARSLLDDLQKDSDAEAGLVEALRVDSPSGLRAAIAMVSKGSTLVPDSLASATQRARSLRAEAKRFSVRFSSATKQRSTKTSSQAPADIDVQAFVRERQEERGLTSLGRLGAAPMLRSAADIVLTVEPTAMLTKPLVECAFDPGQRAYAAEALMTARSILGWTGDVPFHSPCLCAQEILQRGLQYPDLRDEICLQLCRHATGAGAAAATSCLRALQLLQICCQVWAPSEALKPYLFHYYYDRVVSDPSAMVQKVCAESIMHVIRGPGIDIPSLDFIDGVRAGEGLRDTLITTAKGSIRVPIEDESTVMEIAEAAADGEGVQYGTEYGLYAASAAKGDYTRSPLLPSDELVNALRKMSDIDSDGSSQPDAEKKKKKRGKRKDSAPRAGPRLYLRKRLLFHGEIETARENDVHQLYMQCKEGVEAGRYGITDPSESLLLAATSCAAQYGERASDLSADLVQEWLQTNVQPSIYKRWRPETWVEDFWSVLAKLDGWSTLEAKANYVRICQRYPLWGTELFAAGKRGRGLKDIPSHCIMGVSWAGIALYGVSGSGKPKAGRTIPTARLLVWTFNELVSWSATADGRGLCLVTLKHDEGDEDGPGREKTRDFQLEDQGAAMVCALLSDYAAAYTSSRSAFLQEAVPMADELDAAEDEEDAEAEEEEAGERELLPDDV